MSDIQAFPVPNSNQHYGMTLRDYFAAKAMGTVYAELVRLAHVEGWPEDWRAGVAQDAYMLADAMLKAREATS